MTSGLGRTNGASEPNVIVLKSKFYVGYDIEEGGWEPNTYETYGWTLIRNSKTSAWKVSTWGY